MHGSVLHAMSWVGLAAAAEERPKANVDVAHWHDTIDGDVIAHMRSHVSSMVPSTPARMGLPFPSYVLHAK